VSIYQQLLTYNMSTDFGIGELFRFAVVFGRRGMV